MFWNCLDRRTVQVLCLLSLFLIDVNSSTPGKMLKKEVNFQKVQEKTYDKLIKNIAFDKAIIDGKVQVYPKVMVFGDEVQFLDENGEIVSQESLLVTKPKEAGKYFGKEVILSPNGDFVAIGNYTGKFGDDMDYIVDEQFTIYNDRREKIYETKGIVGGTDNGWLISNKDGSLIGTRIAYGAIDFYSPDGSIKTVPLFGELGWRNAVGKAILSGGGEYLAVLARDVPGPRREVRFHKADLWIMLFDIKGNELWRSKVDEQEYGNMAISDHGEYLFFKAFTFGEKKERKNKGQERPLVSVTLSLCDKEGNEVSFKDSSLFAFGGFCFAPQANYVALAGGNVISFMKTKDRSTVFETKLSRNHKIRDILFTKDGEYLIVKTEAQILSNKAGEQYNPIHTRSVFVFNMKGDQVWRKDFSNLERISTQDGYLLFLFPQRYEIYRKN